MNSLLAMRMQGPSLALISGSGIRHCLELWCRLQMRLRSYIAVAVAVAGSYSLIRLLAWELPYATGAALKRQKRKKESEQNKSWQLIT